MKNVDFYGYIVLAVADKQTAKSSVHFRGYFDNAISMKEQVVLQGNCYEGVLENVESHATLDTPLKAGSFFLCGDDKEQPQTAYIIERSSTLISFLSGEITNAEKISRDTNIIDRDKYVAGGAVTHSHVKLFVRMNNLKEGFSENPDVEDNFAARVKRKIISKLDGNSWNFVLANLGPLSTFILASSRDSDLRLHVVYFDGIYAVFFTNSHSIFKSIITEISASTYKNRLFCGNNLMAENTLCVMHCYLLLNNFSKWYKMYRQKADTLLVIPSIERYLSKNMRSTTNV